MKHILRFLPLILFFGLSFGCAAPASRDNHSRIKNEADRVQNDAAPAQSNFIEISDAAASPRRRGVVGEARGGSNFSEIVTMIDGFGNKVEHRCFDSHPRLRCVVLNTHANGIKKAQAFSKTGRIFSLPDELAEDSLTTSPNDIADALNIPEPPPPTASLPEPPARSENMIAEAQVMPFTVPEPPQETDPPESETTPAAKLPANTKETAEIKPTAPPVLTARRDLLLMTSSANEVFKSAKAGKLK